MKVALRNPIDFDGEIIKEIDLDFESLTGNHIMLAERQFVSFNPSNMGNMAKEFSKEYQACVAAQAAKLPFEFFLKTGGFDFTNITSFVQLFFTGNLEREGLTQTSSEK